MGERAPRTGGARASGALGGAGRVLVCLRDRADDLELSDSRNHGPWHLQPWAAHGALRDGHPVVERRAFRPGGCRGAEALADESGSAARAPALAHNPPSGPTHPREGDIAAKGVAEAAQALDIRIHDRAIAAGPGWSSLPALGLI